ncbi:MAG: hypothetical protein OEZ14_06705 [Acidimicrobiia bacterium]|nr:hypothetical protein [Acidimicrobiia bacterium]MDH5520205.1 hypothetical protein [Acidimicrobiia bacterium]
MDNEFLSRSGLTVDMLLCDAAQVAGGKLFVLGGGLASIGPKPQPLAIALQITVPWDRANIAHDWQIELIDEDGQPVVVNEKPVLMRGRFEAGRPAGLQPGSPLGVSLAINLSPFRLSGGRSYAFSLMINDESRPDWRVRFFVKPAPAG